MQEILDITWEEVYKCWRYCGINAPSVLQRPLVFEELNFECKVPNSFIYGYDWVTNECLQKRKKELERNPVQFFLFQSSSKGTIHTLNMLAEAETEEEIAAIWIYAIAFDLLQKGMYGKSAKELRQICDVTQRFLIQRFYFWHHAMRNLVPQIYTNYLLRAGEFESIQSLMEMIVVNAALIRHEYVSVLYSSLKPGERRNEDSVRLRERRFQID